MIRTQHAKPKKLTIEETLGIGTPLPKSHTKAEILRGRTRNGTRAVDQRKEKKNRPNRGENHPHARTHVQRESERKPYLPEQRSPNGGTDGSTRRGEWRGGGNPRAAPSSSASAPPNVPASTLPDRQARDLGGRGRGRGEGSRRRRGVGVGVRVRVRPCREVRE